MPTELLLPGAHPWVQMRAVLAEIDRREGYEVQLRAALLVCLSPLEVQQIDTPPCTIGGDGKHMIGAFASGARGTAIEATRN